jgi:3-hydroxyacyl-CoA dehydrogenase
VVEKLDVKQTLFGRLAPHLGPRSIVSTNTSGIPIQQIAEASPTRRGPPAFPRHALLQSATLPAAGRTDPGGGHRSRRRGQLRAFLDVRLGKGVVIAHDRPGFIANRIGVYGMARTLELVATAGSPSTKSTRSAAWRSGGQRARRSAPLTSRARHPREGGRRPGDEPEGGGVPPAAVRRGHGRRGCRRREGRPRILPEVEGGRRFRDPRPRSGHVDVRAARQAALRVGRRGALDRRRQAPGEGAVPREGPRRRVPARHARADAALRRAHRAGRRRLDRRHRPRDAVGLCWELGPFETWDAIGIAEVLGALGIAPGDAPALVADAAASGRNTFRDGPLPPATPDYAVLALRDRARPQSARTPAPRSWIWATACWP